MERPKGGTNISHSREEKLSIIKRVLKGETTAALDYCVSNTHSHYPS